ncbi:unnamed protein product [Closterium sp. NIES-65]|nr:unnamed protein product [Closterium sp. NIES-65]
MATPSVLTFDAEGRAVDFEVWVDDLQLFLQCDRADGLSLIDLTSGASLAPPADADSTFRSQWAIRDAAAHLAVHRHLPTTERTHFSQYESAKTLYDVVVARYSSPATAALSRLMLPYLFPDLAAFHTVADLITHLRTSDTRYRAALPAEFCAKNPPPMYITLYYIVTRLPDSLRSVRDHFLSVCPTTLTVDLLEERLPAAEKSIVAVGASRGDPHAPFFQGCSPSHLLPSVASAAAVGLVGFESVGAASAPSGSRRTGKGKGGKGAGGAGGGGGGGGGGSGGGGGGGGSGGGGGGRGGGTGPYTYVLRTGDRAGEQCGGSHSTQRCFGRLTDAWRHQFPDATEIPRWGELCRAGVAIFDLDYDAILAAMYAVSTSDEGDCYLCVPPDPGIEAAALGVGEAATLSASASAAPGAGESALSAPSGTQSGLYLPLFSTNLVSGADLQDGGVDQFTPAGQRAEEEEEREEPAGARDQPQSVGVRGGEQHDHGDDSLAARGGDASGDGEDSPIVQGEGRQGDREDSPVARGGEELVEHQDSPIARGGEEHGDHEEDAPVARGGRRRDGGEDSPTARGGEKRGAMRGAPPAGGGGRCEDMEWIRHGEAREYYNKDGGRDNLPTGGREQSARRERSKEDACGSRMRRGDEGEGRTASNVFLSPEPRPGYDRSRRMAMGGSQWQHKAERDGERNKDGRRRRSPPEREWRYEEDRRVRREGAGAPEAPRAA